MTDLTHHITRTMTWVAAASLLLMPGVATLAQEVAATDAQAEARALEISRELSARQQAIEEMQSELGIYAPALMEAYGDLATFHTELEDYENAVRLYTDALQVARINTGLYSEPQLAIIDALIDNNRQLKDWQEVDDLHELNYHISSRLHGLADAPFLAAAARYGDWKLRVVRENLLGLSSWALINQAEDLSDFYDGTIARAEAQAQLRPENLLVMLYGKSQIDMVLARSIASTPYTAFEGTQRRYINQTRCTNVRNASGQIVRQCYQVQIENPRYRQSQREAKQFALSRQTREIGRTIDRLRLIKDTSNSLTSGDRQQLEVQIAQLQTESEQLLRVSRRRSLF